MGAIAPAVRAVRGGARDFSPSSPCKSSLSVDRLNNDSIRAPDGPLSAKEGLIGSNKQTRCPEKTAQCLSKP